MEAKIRFEVQTSVPEDIRERLAEIGVCRQNNGLWVWDFPIERIGEIEVLLAKPVEFGREDISKFLDSRAPPRIEIVKPDPFKGDSGRIVEETPMVYTIRWWQKSKKLGKPVRHCKNVPRESVVLLREAIRSLRSSMPDDSDIPFSKTTEKVCQLLGIDKIFRRYGKERYDSGVLYGSRGDYDRYYDYPMTVLQTLGEIIRHARGGVEIVKLKPIDLEMAERIHRGSYDEIKQSIDGQRPKRGGKKKKTAEPMVKKNEAADAKIYECGKCGDRIDEDQALKTNKIIKRQLCKKCETEFVRNPWDSQENDTDAS